MENLGSEENTKAMYSCFKTLLVSWIFIIPIHVFGQEGPSVLKKLKADRIEYDEGNGDGVFKARNKKTQKWGMYQWMDEGTEITELVPMEYDSIRDFPFNGAFTAVYKNGKVGFYLSKWTYDEKARQTVPCLYEDYQRYTPEDGITRLAVQKDDRWGWVDWMTGEEKSEFKYLTKEELPYPDWEQEY